MEGILQVKCILVGDVGGTNTRLNLYSYQKEGQFTLVKEGTKPTASIPTMS